MLKIGTAHEQSQKYKEGKFVLERYVWYSSNQTVDWLLIWLCVYVLWTYVLDRVRIVDGLDSEFYIDTRPSSSNAEEA